MNWVRVLYSVMEDAVKNSVEALGNLVEVFKRQFAFIQLSVDKDIVDDLLYHTLDAVRGWVDKCSGGGLNTVGQHDDAGFSGLRFGAGIAEILFLDRVGI